MTKIMLDTAGERVVVQEGQSSDFTVTLFQMNGTTKVDAATVTTLELTLFLKGGNSINSRLSQDVKNENGGTIAASVLTVRLDNLDNVIVGTVAVGEKETHVGRIEFTWNDGEQLRYGGEDFEFQVRKVAAPS